MVTEVYGHILDEDRKKNAQLMKVLGNPEMAALLTSLAKSMNLNNPPEMVHRSTKNMKKNTRRGLYHITPEFPEEICQASFRGLSPRFRQPLLFHNTSI